MDDCPRLEGVDFDTQLPIVDRERLDMLLAIDDGNDGRRLIREIFDIFKSEGLEKLERLDSICQNNELAELRSSVHFVAGSAGNLGLMRLNGFLRALEEAIEGGQFSVGENSADVIRAAFDSACAAFEAEL